MMICQDFAFADSAYLQVPSSINENQGVKQSG